MDARRLRLLEVEREELLTLLDGNEAGPEEQQRLARLELMLAVPEMAAPALPGWYERLVGEAFDDVG